MCILESFCQFEVRAHVGNGFLLTELSTFYKHFLHPMDSFFNLLPLYTHVSRKVLSVSEISTMNFMVG